MDKRERDGDGVNVVQLCMDASTRSMVASLGHGRIQVKGEIVRNCDDECVVKVDKTSKIKERTYTRICAHYQLTNTGYS